MQKRMDIDYIWRDVNVLQPAQAGAPDGNNAVTKAVINMYGIVGIGKTFMLQQLFDQYKHEYDVIWLGFNLKDVDLDGRAGGYAASLTLRPKSWSEVIEILNTLPGLNGRIGQQMIFDVSVSQSIDQMGDILFARARGGTAQRRLLLLLDSLDNLPYLKWLQEQIIKPIMELGDATIVCASRMPLHWHFWEIRDECMLVEIEGFSKSETREFLRQYNCDLLAETVHDLVGGYPLVLKQFSKILVAPTLNSKVKSDIAAEIATLPPEMQQILQQIGIMRRSHVLVMQSLLESAEITSLERDFDQHRRLHLTLSELRSRDFIRSSPDILERFAPELRHLLREQLPTTDYLRRCGIIADSYYKIAYQQPKTAAHAFVEWLFFSTEPFIAHQVTDREAWMNQLNDLIDRVQEVTLEEQTGLIPGSLSDENIVSVRTDIGPKVIAWLYTDGELLQKLEKLRLLDVLHERMEPLLTGEVPIRHDLRRACSDVIEEIGQRVQMIGTPGMRIFEIVLRNLLPVDGPKRLDQAKLRERLSDTWRLLKKRPPRTISELIATLNSSSILLYDRGRRTYTFHPLIEKLLSVAPRNRFSEEPILQHVGS